MARLMLESRISAACLLVSVLLLGIDAGEAQTDRSAPAMLERVLPSVVTVAVYRAQTAKRAFGYAADPMEAAYRRVLDLSGAASAGSGFVIERNGKKYIVTNAHVVEQAGGGRSISVYSINQTKYAVRVVGGDSFYDLALLEFEGDGPGREYTTVDFGRVEPRIGDPVYAIGNPLGEYPYSVTEGIVGGKNRMFEGLTGKFGYLQSTATVIWGNSGGPLVNGGGEVVGVNSRIEIQKRGDQMFVQPQLNFALEAKIADRVVHDILTNNGRVRRSFFGLEIAQRYRVEGENAEHATAVDLLPVIAAVVPDGPAARALKGKEGAKVLRINSIAIRNTEEALGALEGVLPGGEVTLELDLGEKHERASFRTEELTLPVLGSLAKFVIERHASVEITGEPDGVKLRPRTSARTQIERPEDERINPSGQSYRYEQNTRRYQKATQGPTEIVVAAAGLVIDEQNVSVWRVNNLADVGVALRLAALSGIVDFVYETPGGADAVRFWLSGEENLFTRTVVY